MYKLSIMLILGATFVLRSAQADETLKINPNFENVTEEHPLCYSKSYSEAHLKAHPKQTVKSMRAKIGFVKEYNQLTLDLEILLKSKPNKKLYATFECIDEKNCIIFCDGGSVDLVKGKNGGIRIINNGINVEGDCGGDIEAGLVEVIFLKTKKGGDDIFDLLPVSDPSTCNLGWKVYN